MTDLLRQRIQHARLTRRGFTAGAAALAATPFLHSRAFAQEASPVAVTMESGGEDQLEIFSWWTSAGEAAGLEQLFNAFSVGNPTAEIVNAAVAGGAGSNAQAALQTRLGAGEAPDSWQSHPGQELFSLYVDPGYTDPINELYAEQGWLDAYPQGLIDQCTRDGNQYLVPVGVHRGNAFFYNRSVLEANGIEVGEALSFDQFFEIAEQLKTAGIPALALGDKDTFAAPQFFENTLVGVLGPDGYNGLWDGATAWDSPEVTSAIEIFARALDYVNPDHAALTWDGAVDVLIQGNAVFTSMGDWAYGEFVTKNVTDQIGWVAHPGSEGAYVTVVDGFTLPTGSPHPINARNWLRTVGSIEAQEAFSPFKGCIPARTDIDTSKFEGYFTWSIEGLASVPSVPSMAHGAAASPQFRQAIFDATVPFIVDRDVETYQVSLQQAAEDAGIGM